MIVLLDLEWIETSEKYLTQLAAIRVDAHWQVSARFEAFVCPADRSVLETEHMALVGYPPERFYVGMPEQECMEYLAAWLEPGDTIWVWAASNQKYFKALWRKYMDTAPPTIYAQSFRTWKLAARAGYVADNPYALAQRAGIVPPSPMHCSANDVEVMRMLFQKLKVPTKDKPGVKKELPTPVKKPQPTLRERNADIVTRTQYNYIYTADSSVFHRRGCKLCLGGKNILGSKYYDASAKDRRPCKACNPIPNLELSPNNAPEAIRRAPIHLPLYSASNKEVITTKMVSGETINIRRGHIVGWCACYLHKGALSKSHLKQHDCLGKGCYHLRKNYESPYWANLEREKRAKEVQRQKKQVEKKKQEKEAEGLRSVQESWQSWLDESQTDMLIARVAQDSLYMYTIFYVSDRPYADGNHYPEFLDMLKSRYPTTRICLRHIRDMDGHFVTTDEYLARPRK